MARIRSLKPEFWADEFLAEHCSRDARMLYLALWNLADEHGRTRAGARYLKGQVFAYDDDIDRSDIDRLLKELAEADRIRMYEVAGERYAFLPKLALHQRLEPGKSASRLPEPPTESNQPDDTGSFRENPDESAPGPGESAPRRKSSGLSFVAGLGIEGQRAPDVSGESTTTRRRPKKPIPADWHPSEPLLAWCAEKHPTVDVLAQVPQFVNHHTARDNRFASFDAAFRTWIGNAARWASERNGHSGAVAAGFSPDGAYTGWRA